MGRIIIRNSSLIKLGTVYDVLSCQRTERINSDNILNFSAPLTTELSGLIVDGNVMELDGDYFDIAYFFKGQESGGSLVLNAECEHVSYRLNDPEYNVEYFTQTGTPSVILSEILSGTGFTVGIISSTAVVTYSVQEAKSRRGLLMDFVNLLSGEIVFDQFEISILDRRGSAIPINLTESRDVNIINKAFNKREKDSEGNALVTHTCSLVRPIDLVLGDTVEMTYQALDISAELRIVSITTNPYDRFQTSFEIGNFVPGLADDAYRIETSMVAKGATYYGARISPENGFESIRSDKMARTVMNADQFAMQTGDGSGSSWTNKLYFDPATGKYVFDGILSATMIEALEAEFDVTISQTVIVNQLSAQKGNIAELTVDQIDTSDFVQRYLDEDTSPVGYWKGYDQFIEFYEAVVPEGDIYYTQVKNRQQQDIYWLDETHAGTTIEITDYPVYRYAYNGDDLAGVVKLKIFHEIDPVTGFATPKMIWGQGSGVDDRMQAVIMKDTDGLLLKYTTSTGEVVALRLGENGFDGVNFAVHGAPPEINNISVYSNGMILVDEFATTVDYTFVRDSKGRITSITNNNSTHVTNVTWNSTAKP